VSYNNDGRNISSTISTMKRQISEAVVSDSS
jgi:hypothetical protein